ncbi:MAG: hypothetical protein HYV42_02255 [Candidatus Magasanikbacteria bacterium]|nr:hypothetical protein [Candidatus Magasanikbacteria bacterium]
MSSKCVRTLEQSISETLAYFDLLDFPLTKEELWRYLWQAPSGAAAAFAAALNRLKTGGTVAEKFGFHYLAGRGLLIEERRARGLVSEQKRQRASQAARLVGRLPFIRAVFLSSSVAAENAAPESDLDFFIITAPGRLWLARFFANALLRLLGWRVYGRERRDRICLCFFVAANQLDLAPLRVADDDIHFAYWLHQMLPLYDPHHYYDQLIAVNRWTRSYLPNIERPTPPIQSELRPSGGKRDDWAERLTRFIQWHWLLPEIKQRANSPDHSVVIAPGALKFHLNDSRERYRQQWRAKIVYFRQDN